MLVAWVIAHYDQAQINDNSDTSQLMQDGMALLAELEKERRTFVYALVGTRGLWGQGFEQWESTWRGICHLIMQKKRPTGRHSRLNKIQNE